MAILGSLLKQGIILKDSLEQLYASPLELQKHELRNLLIHSQNTKFGNYYNINKILSLFKGNNTDTFYEVFSNHIPLFSYEEIYNQWWCKSRQGINNVCWPGKIKYFALSSGTSGSASKYIPITQEMLKSIRRASIRQILTLPKYKEIPASLYSKGILMLGGSTNLQKNGHYFEGDLSGITTSQIPFWFQHFYKPGKKIARTRNWKEKLDEIVLKAPTWDIGMIVGVPAWLQILLEKIIDKFKISTIHEIWPSLQIFVHGGVPFEPYKKGFEKLLQKPLTYLETYLASEGFIAFQAFPNRKPMKLLLNNGIFYEFIPFTKRNFDEKGAVTANAKALKIDEVSKGVDYALVITTNAGAWRYLIGDVIRFVSVKECEIIITGRTQQFMSLCGEHLSLDNLNKAIELTENELNIDIREFTLLGELSDTRFIHHWYIGTDDSIESSLVSNKIDQYLKKINDDYKTERYIAIKEVIVTVLPPSVFYTWLEKQGKVGGQNKFPRVLKDEKAEDWKSYLNTFDNI